MYVYIYIDTCSTECVCIYIYTGRTIVALVELPTLNMFDFFLCTPFPLRILAVSYPGQISTPTPATRNGLGNVICG